MHVSSNRSISFFFLFEFESKKLYIRLCSLYILFFLVFRYMLFKCYLVGGFHQNRNVLVHNIKNKTKRLNQLNHSINNNIPAMISTVKKVISHTSDVNKMVNKQLVTVQQKPVILKSMVPSSLSNKCHLFFIIWLNMDNIRIKCLMF